MSVIVSALCHCDYGRRENKCIDTYLHDEKRERDRNEIAETTETNECRTELLQSTYVCMLNYFHIFIDVISIQLVFCGAFMSSAFDIDGFCACLFLLFMFEERTGQCCQWGVDFFRNMNGCVNF